ncbi:hypothetical protein AVEN_162468-1, partial [Araneus ventricosus]
KDVLSGRLQRRSVCIPNPFSLWDKESIQVVFRKLIRRDTLNHWEVVWDRAEPLVVDASGVIGRNTVLEIIA